MEQLYVQCSVRIPNTACAVEDKYLDEINTSIKIHTGIGASLINAIFKKDIFF